MLELGSLPEAYVPPKPIRELRELRKRLGERKLLRVIKRIGRASAGE